MPNEKRMCKFCGRDGTARSMYFHSGGVYGECLNVVACEKRRLAGDRRSDRDEAHSVTRENARGRHPLIPVTKS